MPTNEQTPLQKAIDYVKRSAGEWVPIKGKENLPPKNGNYHVLCTIVRDNNIVRESEFIGGIWWIENDYTIVTHWLDPADATKEQILNTLSSLVVGESDFHAYESFQLNSDAIPTSYQIWKSALTHARIQMQAEQSAEIKALEEKVRLLEDVMLFVQRSLRLSEPDTEAAEVFLTRYNQLP